MIQRPHTSRRSRGVSSCHSWLGEISLTAEEKILVENGEIVCSRKQKSDREMRHSQSVSEVPDVDERVLYEAA